MAVDCFASLAMTISAVGQMERSEIRGRSQPMFPDCVALYPGYENGDYVPFNAAISFVALSSSTLTSSLRLAGGSSATPSWRGITCTCR